VGGETNRKGAWEAYGVKMEELKKLDDSELIALRVSVEKELECRGIALTVGEMGETLTIDCFNRTPGLPNLQKAPTGTKNVDALSREGDRYSIKTIQKGKKTGTIYPNPSDPNKQLFEYILISKLDGDLHLLWTRQFTWKEFEEYRSWDSRMNAWYMGCSAKTLKKGALIYGKESQTRIH